ncbi:MAG TPA: hypothetical protein VGI93_14370 [Steroidobacteraceae bacterium]|jgi:hypothetical protein
MDTNLIRANNVVDGWPVLVACAAYVIFFSIAAAAMTSVFLVA